MPSRWVKAKSSNLLFLWSLEGVTCENRSRKILIVRWIIHLIKSEKNFWKNDLKSIWSSMMHWSREAATVIMSVSATIDKNSINKEQKSVKESKSCQFNLCALFTNLRPQSHMLSYVLSLTGKPIKDYVTAMMTCVQLLRCASLLSVFRTDSWFKMFIILFWKYYDFTTYWIKFRRRAYWCRWR